MNKYGYLITRISILNLINSEGAKDYFQNVFIKLYIKEDDFIDDKPLKARLIRMCINMCYNYQDYSTSFLLILMT